LTTYEKPTTNSKYEFIVAIPAVFSRRGNLKTVMAQSLENAVFKGAAGARRLQTTGDGMPSSLLMRQKTTVALKEQVMVA